MTTEPKILVVDDDIGNRYFKTHVLSRCGYGVLEAECGADALRIIAEERPAVVLLDVKLPDISGGEVCRSIKTRYPGILVLQTSAKLVDAKQRAAGLEGGADSYLAEPIEPDELTANVRALLRLYEAEHDLRQHNEQLEIKVAARTKELVERTQQLASENQKRMHAEEALRHAEKLDAVGQLTGGLAHDFNNLLMVVLGNLDSLERRLKNAGHIPDGASRLIVAARRAAEDGANLTRQLLAFSRRDMLRPEVLDANEAIAGFDQMLSKAVGERVQLELHLCEDPWRFMVDRTQLEAALLNLAGNARDAMPMGGVLRISSRNASIASPEMVKSHTILALDAQPGDYVEIAVTDTGSGMSEQTLRHAFEPFFTTKDVGYGSGLGLSQVYSFVRQTKGFLAIDTEINAGTTIHLFLPRTMLIPSLPIPLTDSARLIGGTEVILVVEDNELVFEVVTSSILQLGYRVLAAKTAAEALDIICSEQPVDLLFTDMVLPGGVGGLELARRARQLRPKLHVLLTSGYAGRTTDNAAESDEFLLLPKPYRQYVLACRLREALQQGLEA